MNHPSLANQLFSDKRNGASLKPRHAGEIGAGNRLAAPDKVENNTAIDAASSLARSDLSIGEVDASHLVVDSNYIGKLRVKLNPMAALSC